MRDPGRSLQPTTDFLGDSQQELGDHRAWLERAARGLGFAPTDAEDLTQAVAATFLEVLPRFERRSSVRTFLFGILRRKAAELRRSRTRVAAIEDTTPPIEASNLQPDAQLEAAQLGRALGECIEALPPKQRSVVELKFMHARETESASREVGISANYFGVLLNRARAHLRDCIGAHGF